MNQGRFIKKRDIARFLFDSPHLRYRTVPRRPGSKKSVIESYPIVHKSIDVWV